MNCRSCGMRNDNGSLYCVECGSELCSNEKWEWGTFKCTSCGQENDKDSFFCVECGKPLQKNEANHRNHRGSTPSYAQRTSSNNHNVTLSIKMNNGSTFSLYEDKEIYEGDVKVASRDKGEVLGRVVIKKDGSGTIGIVNLSDREWTAISHNGVRKMIQRRKVVPVTKGMTICFDSLTVVEIQ